MNRFRFYVVVTLLFICSVSFAQILEPVKWVVSQKSLGNDSYELIFKASIEQNWHLYSQDVAMQPPATLFTFEKNENIQLIGKVLEKSKVHEVFDSNFEMTVKYFENEAIFAQKIKVLTKKEVLLEGYFEFMSCDDTQCTPPIEEDFEFVFNKNK